MVTNGELVSNDGRYTLAGRLLERQREQDEGQSVNTADWDGAWLVAVAANDRRSMTERRAFRESMVGSRLGELRPDIWMRPANLPGPARSADILITSGPLECDDPDDLVGRLWSLGELEATARRLHDALTRQRPAIDDGNIEQLPQTFTVAAAAVRFLRIEPQLPAALAPPVWTATALRPLYDEYNQAFQRQLRTFFASIR